MVLPPILRIIDVNINRVSEGLRVLEDVSRFILEDTESSRKLKSIRHFISQLTAKADLPLTQVRDAEGDIGAEFDLTNGHVNLVSLVRANSMRVQEGLRVLEELAKLPDIRDIISSEYLRTHRYSIYTLEKHLLAELGGQNKWKIQREENGRGKAKKNRNKAG